MRTLHVLPAHPVTLPARMPARTHTRRRGLSFALLCALGCCALPLAGRAQQAKSALPPGDAPASAMSSAGLTAGGVPVLADPPSLGRLFAAPSTRSLTIVWQAAAPPALPVGIPLSRTRNLNIVWQKVSPAEKPAKPVLVNMDARNASLAVLIDLLMEQAHASYTLSQKLTAEPVGNVKLRNIPFRDALDALLKMSRIPVMYRVENGVYRIMLREEQTEEPSPNAESSSPALPVQIAPNAAGETEPRLTISVENATLYSTLKTVFQRARVNFMLDNTLRDSFVTVDIHNQPLHQVVETLLKAGAKNMTFRVENGVYSIVPRAGSIETLGGKP